MKSLKEFIAESLEKKAITVIKENTEKISENENEGNIQETKNVEPVKTEK